VWSKQSWARRQVRRWPTRRGQQCGIRERERRIDSDVRYESEVMDRRDLSVGQAEFNEVSGACVAWIAEDGEYLATVEPPQHEVPVADVVVVREVAADVAPPGALQAGHQIETDVLGEQRAHTVPVARIE